MQNDPGSGSFLVTGAAGCIGSWVVAKLTARGTACVALDLNIADAPVWQLADEEVRSRTTFVEGDVTDDRLLPKLIGEHEITRIIHLAALQIPLVAENPRAGAAVNVGGASHGVVRNIVYASSAAVFGPEAGLRKPRTLYGVFKACEEDVARVYADDFGIRNVGLRPWAVFGPGRDQGLTAAPTLAIEAVVSGRPYHIPFGGRIDLQYVEDVADTFIAAAFVDPLGPVVCNLRGTVVEIEEFTSLVGDLWPAARELLSNGSEPLPIHPELDDSTLRALIGEPPRTELTEAVRRTAEHFAGGRASTDRSPDGTLHEASSLTTGEPRAGGG
jgi:nucleoside-diphosphate-sugar epimerase